MNFCKDCIHVVEPDSSYPRCMRPTGKLNLVDGKKIFVDTACVYERVNRLCAWERCGIQGRFFQRKEQS